MLLTIKHSCYIDTNTSSVTTRIRNRLLLGEAMKYEMNEYTGSVYSVLLRSLIFDL